MHSFSLVSLLMMGHVTSTLGVWHDELVCPGQYSLIPRPSLLYEDLYFETGSSKKQVANSTHIFLPSYQRRGATVFIPEVWKQHEGDYIWYSNILKNWSPQVIKLVLKDCADPRKLYYGDEFTLTVPKEASVLEFTTPRSTDRWLLWSRINGNYKRGARGVVKDDCWKASKITHADAGRYAFLKESGDEISSTRLFVKELQRHHNISDKSFKESKIPVPVFEAVLEFIDSNKAKHVLFDNGVLTDKAFNIFGSRISMQLKFGELTLTVMDLQPNDTGKYNVCDKNKGLAIAMHVHNNIASSSSSSSSSSSLLEWIDILAPIAVTFLVLLLCCLQVRNCYNHCKKRDVLVASPGSQQSDHVHETSRTEYYPPSAEETERRLWAQSSSSLTYRKASDPPPYDEIAGNHSVPCPPYSPAAPMEV